MTAPEEQSPRGRGDPRIAAALAADPDLAAELEMILGAFDVAARERFLVAFADELPRHVRPAAAVLTSLERAARGQRRGPGEGRAGGRRA